MSQTISAPSEAVQRFLVELSDHDCLDDSTLARALYSSDASLYRVVPQIVARPRSRDELVSVARAALNAGLPITARGAGTSCAGNAVGAGLVIDVARHLNRIIEIDPVAKTALIEPGVVQTQLTKAALPHGLRYGPDPSTANRCTVGGMIGNNACGPRALGYGRSADNIIELEILTGDGELVWLRPGDPDGKFGQLKDLVESNLATIRTEFGRFGRQVSGYSLEHLLPENGFDLASFFAGTEGTLGIITQARVRLVTDKPVQLTVALGYPTMVEAADDIANLLQFKPVACEGMDRRLTDVVADRLGAQAVPPLPAGDGWMFIELVGDSDAEVLARANALVEAAKATEGWVLPDPLESKPLWAIRSDAAGLAGVALDDPAFPGWEDAAVPPDQLGNYLREFEELLVAHGLHGLPYGHFGDGCIHCRIDFPLAEADGPQRYKKFVSAAADLVAKYGGSMSGEHGDGRARSELLPKMYSPAALQLFGAVKEIFDPRNLLNPGVLVDPRPLDADVRVNQIRRSPILRRDPQFAAAVHQCSGVGKCLADGTGAGQVMCPSFQATRDEKDSTRGRARVLQELVNGQLVKGWDAPEVAEALDLCLACKGCRRDCPTGIDMAAYKSHVLDRKYRRKLRPTSHYVLGWLPRWGRLVTRLRIGWLANLAMRTPGLKQLALGVAGVDARRPLPPFRKGASARQRIQSDEQTRLPNASAAATQRPDRDAIASPSQEDLTPATFAAATADSAANSRYSSATTTKQPVAVWVDSFSDAFQGDQLPDLLKVLLHAGFEPQLIEGDACCGLTWITTGQLDGARRQLRRALKTLHPIAAAGIPIVGIEPSCLAVWRSDAAELLPGDQDVQTVAAATRTLAELLSEFAPDWTPPQLTGHTIVAQPHCHHASVLGWRADAELLAKTGAEVITLGGCCGLAGNFGVERGHYEVSVAVAEHDLLPAIEAAGPEAIVLADGFSCRKQVSDLTDHQAMTFAQIIAAHLG